MKTIVTLIFTAYVIFELSAHFKLILPLSGSSKCKCNLFSTTENGDAIVITCATKLPTWGLVDLCFPVHIEG